MARSRIIKEVSLRAFEHATESHERVVLALETVSGSKTFRETPAEGYHGNPITVLETVLGSGEGVEAFWGRLRREGLLPGIEENLEERINESGELFIRFDKQAAVDGRLLLSSGDDVVIARVRVVGSRTGSPACSRRDRAIEEMRRFLKELREADGPGREL